MCGAEQPEADAPIKASAVPSVRPAPAPARSGGAGRLLQVAGAIALLALLGLLAWKLYPRFAPPPPAPQAPAVALPPPPIVVPSARVDPRMGAADLSAVEPGAVLVKTQSHAKRWHRDAQLVSLDATPVIAGKVDAKNGGRVVVTYASPAGGSLLPGTRVSAGRFVVTVDAAGPKTSELEDAKPARSVAEPNCPFDRAWRTMIASGVPSSSRVTVHYSMSDKLDRAVWQTHVEGKPKLSRTIDAENCAIVASP